MYEREGSFLISLPRALSLSFRFRAFAVEFEFITVESRSLRKSPVLPGAAELILTIVSRSRRSEHIEKAHFDPRFLSLYFIFFSLFFFFSSVDRVNRASAGKYTTTLAERSRNERAIVRCNASACR